MPPPRLAYKFTVGARVFLRGCPHGEPGRVLRMERGRVVVLWADLGPTYIGRHKAASLLLATDTA